MRSQLWGWHMFIIPKLGRLKQKDPWGSLANWPNLLEGSRSQWDHVSKKISRLTSDLHMYTCMPIHTQIPVHTHILKHKYLHIPCIYTHKETAFNILSPQNSRIWNFHCLQSQVLWVYFLFIECVYMSLSACLCEIVWCIQGWYKNTFSVEQRMTFNFWSSFFYPTPTLPVYEVLRMEPRVSCMIGNAINSVTTPTPHWVL